MSIDKDAIARQYAITKGKEIVELCVIKGEYSYYRIDYAIRPRYLGHPHIIKIDNNGEVIRVLDLEEIYLVLHNRTTSEKQFTN